MFSGVLEGLICEVTNPGTYILTEKIAHSITYNLIYMHQKVDTFADIWILHNYQVLYIINISTKKMENDVTNASEAIYA